MNTLIRRLGFAAVAALVPAVAFAQTGVKKELLADLDEVHGKLVQLANAMPAAKFHTWSPPGARPLSAVLLHVAAENFDIPPMAGATASTTKMPAEFETKVTDKTSVLELLNKSYAYAKQAVTATPDGQLDAAASYFGTPTTKRGVLIKLSAHGNEHLGQLIAYLRMNNIAPPWSR